MIDLHGKVQFWNQAAERIFGYSQDEVMNRNLHEIVVPSRFADAQLDAFRKFQRTGKGEAVGKTIELACIRKDGTEFPADLSLTAIKMQDEWGAVGILRDITDRKQNEEARINQQKELEIYTSLLRHDLGNDLGGIVGALEVAKMMMIENPEEAMQFLDSSLALTNRMSQLLSAVSRTQDTGDEQIVKMLRRVAKISADTKIGLEIQVLADDEFEELKVSGGRLLPMVFENLFRNAVQHAGETPVIKVEIDADDTLVHIIVSDNGPGISQAVADKLFERGVSTKEEGGLGLYLSKKIVETFGGSIQILPMKEGIGAQFEIKMPRKS
jgi:PAS domain S-box-containing protein